MAPSRNRKVFHSSSHGGVSSFRYPLPLIFPFLAAYLMALASSHRQHFETAYESPPRAHMIGVLALIGGAWSWILLSIFLVGLLAAGDGVSRRSRNTFRRALADGWRNCHCSTAI